MSAWVKTAGRFWAAAAVWPARLCHLAARSFLGPQRACQMITEQAARWPGIPGEYRRRCLLGHVLARVGPDTVVSYGTLFSKPTAEVGARVYIGAYCVFGDVRIGDDTLIADQVCIPSGARQHGIAALDRAIRDQPGEYRTIRVGADCWIGTGAIVLADVGDHCVVAAGSVVTRPVPDFAVVAGNPARPIGDRRRGDAIPVPEDLAPHDPTG